MRQELIFRPSPLEPVAVSHRGEGPRLRRGAPFRLLSWNLQFAASRRYFFFYDGGPDVHADPAVVRSTLEAMGDLIATEGPEVVLLQEVDRDSARTGRIDQLDQLAQRTHLAHVTKLAHLPGLRCHASEGAQSPFDHLASTPYHRSRFVPAPIRNPLGRVDLHLVTGSAFQVAWARRRALPALNEPFWRRAFNLKRAVLEVALPLAGEDLPLVLLNTHLSAFSFGDGTMTRQVAVILDRLSFLDERGIPWILAGDFNLLPPWDNPERLGQDAGQFADRHNPMIPLFRRYQSGLRPEPTEPTEPWRDYSYLPFGAERPDRRLDYLFVSQGVELMEQKVIHQDHPSSDHLPLLLVAAVKP